MFVLCLQLLVGSEDFDIRVFKEDELVSEITENEVNGWTVFYSIHQDSGVLFKKCFELCFIQGTVTQPYL